MKQIDDKAREVLRYLNMNTNLSNATLAEVFNQHYKEKAEETLEVLFYLEQNELVRVKNDMDGIPIMIQVTHLGKTYEQEMLKLEQKEKDKILSDRIWNIITLCLSAVLTIIINLVMKWGFGI